MSLIKMVGLGGTISKELPDKKVVIIRGSMREHFLYVVESLLAKDTSGYYGEIDMKAGKQYKDLDGELFITFANGGIKSVDKVIQTAGVLPNIHVVRYTGVGDTFRSFYLEQGLSTYSSVYTDMRKYSRALGYAQWFRLITVVNDLLGYEFVTLMEEKLQFNPSEACGVPVEAQKLIYMLMAECYLTPAKIGHRVVLLSDVPGLDNKTQIKFMRRLADIPYSSVILSTSGVDYSDISEGYSISFLNV